MMQNYCSLMLIIENFSKGAQEDFSKGQKTFDLSKYPEDSKYFDEVDKKIDQYV